MIELTIDDLKFLQCALSAADYADIVWLERDRARVPSWRAKRAAAGSGKLAQPLRVGHPWPWLSR